MSRILVSGLINIETTLQVDEFLEGFLTAPELDSWWAKTYQGEKI